MSNFKVIGDIGETLKDLLNDDTHWKDITKPDITLKSPKEIKDQGDNINIISIYLYSVMENIHFKNKELQKIDHSTLGYPPMAVDLFYLITPYGSDPTQEKYMMGKVMQVLYDHSILTGSVLHGSLKGTDEEIKLIFNPLSLDDLNKIWSTFQETGYRLSISYIATPVMIDSIRKMSIQRVVSAETGHYYRTPKKQV